MLEFVKTLPEEVLDKLATEVKRLDGHETEILFVRSCIFGMLNYSHMFLEGRAQGVL